MSVRTKKRESVHENEKDRTNEKKGRNSHVSTHVPKSQI